MPYIAFELDAIRKASHVAAAVGVARATISDGLLQLWEHCWREKTDVVQAAHVRAFFTCDAAEALAAFNFLEVVPGGYRVKGADRYLRIHAARSAGGKAASGNLKRGTKPGASREPAGATPPAAAGSQPGVQPGVSPGSAPALTASSEQRTANLKKALSSSPELNPSVTQSGTNPETEQVSSRPVDDRPRQVFEHWQRVMSKPRAVFDSKRRSRVEARLKDGHSLDQLLAAVDGCAKTPHNMGQNERGERYDDLELICRDSAHVERFVANEKAAPLPKSPSAREEPKCKTPQELLAEQQARRAARGAQ